MGAHEQGVEDDEEPCRVQHALARHLDKQRPPDGAPEQVGIGIEEVDQHPLAHFPSQVNVRLQPYVIHMVGSARRLNPQIDNEQPADDADNAQGLVGKEMENEQG